MNYENKIKELRTKKHILQDKLAIELSDNEHQITKKQISMWERGKELPDTLSLIRIADYFGATTDELLGRTEYMAEEKREEIIKQAISLTEQKKYEECFKLWHEAVQRYPGDFKLRIIFAGFLTYAYEQDKKQLSYEIKKHMKDECIVICNHILMYCTDEEIRSSARLLLVEQYINEGNWNLALDVAKQAPKEIDSRLDLLKTVAKHSWKTEARSELAIERFKINLSTLIYLSDQFKGMSDKDSIGLKSVNAICDILFEKSIMELIRFCDKETVQKSRITVAGYHLYITSMLINVYARNKDASKTLEYLASAKKQVECILSNLPMNNVKTTDLKLNLSAQEFDFLREDERFIELEKSLKSFDVENKQ